MLGRLFTYQDTNTYGELFAGALLSSTPPPVNVLTSTDTVILSFNQKAPVQTLTPIDQCGNPVDSSAVTITFASLTEFSPSAQVVQQFDFQNKTYELNTTFANESNPAFNFGLNTTSGLQVACKYLPFFLVSTFSKNRITYFFFFFFFPFMQ